MKLTLEKPVYGGDCLARLDSPQSPGKSGKTIFVPLTLPGETVQARITEDKRTFARAEPEAILTASPDRVMPPCPHFGPCGGCHYQHASYPAQLVLKQQILRETLLRAKVPIPGEIETLSAEPWHYRNRIRLALAQDTQRSQQIGYRGRRSHDLVPIRECPLAAPILVATAFQIAASLARNPAPVAISELELFTNHDESQLLITLFCETGPKELESASPQDWLASLHSSLPPQATGVLLELDNGSLDPTILASSGGSSLTYKAAGLDYRVGHGAFFQVNRHLLDQFAALVTTGPEGPLAGSLAWDLYAGVGLFARRLAASFEQVHAVESAPSSIAALRHNLSGTASQAISATTLDYLRRNREQREPRPDLIVLDPPRAGLGDEVTHLLNAIGAPFIVYVSCDPATLARDLQTLTRERYNIESIHLVDMFPQTFHLETVVRLRRS